ncbi:unnamed protein product, partial [Nesidiocoris tenuis]
CDSVPYDSKPVSRQFFALHFQYHDLHLQQVLNLSTIYSRIGVGTAFKLRSIGTPEEKLAGGDLCYRNRLSRLSGGRLSDPK